MSVLVAAAVRGEPYALALVAWLAAASTYITRPPAGAPKEDTR